MNTIKNQDSSNGDSTLRRPERLNVDGENEFNNFEFDSDNELDGDEEYFKE